MMKLNNKYKSLIINFTVIFSILELLKNKNFKRAMKKPGIIKKIKILILLIIHNVIFFVIYFSLPIFLYYLNQVTSTHLLFYLFILIIVPLHWYTNNNRCWFTVKQNQLLGIDENIAFRDFISTLFNIEFKYGSGNKLSLREKIYSRQSPKL